jgi:hypothetical protein
MFSRPSAALWGLVAESGVSHDPEPVQKVLVISGAKGIQCLDHGCAATPRTQEVADEGCCLFCIDSPGWYEHAPGAAREEGAGVVGQIQALAAAGENHDQWRQLSIR